MYATSTRGHDSTWYLQNELVTIDRQVASARRYGVKVPGARGGGRIPLSARFDSDEAAGAEQAVRRIAGHRGMSEAQVREVLEALGLAEPAAPEPPPAREPFPTGACPHCERIVHLRKDDTLIAHTADRRAVPGSPRCPGSHALPRPEATP